MRIFVALDIEESIRTRVQCSVEDLRGLAPEVRWVSAASLHVTLKFIGEKPADIVEQVKCSLAQVRGGCFEVSFRGYGFFPEAKSPRVFWLGIDAPRRLFELAEGVDQAIGALGIAKESYALHPHLTLARSGGGSPRRRPTDGPNRRFERLQERLAATAPPDFGGMTVREFFLFQSQTSSSGARYTKLGRFSLEDSH
jgi:RNA 2',3'-cyclic 3'-phosphodiesterase